MSSNSLSDTKMLNTRSLVTAALFAALLCIAAYISIPLPIPGSPHITLLNFVILLIALLFPLPIAFMTILVWMLLGVIGLPVFIGGGAGYGYLLNMWGGYTLSFLVIAIVLPLIRGRKYNRIRYTIAAIAGALLIDFLGMIYLKAMGNLPWKAAFLTGFVPFLPLDLLKAFIAAQIVPAFKKVLPEKM
ncbi:MAG: biotin transporter BioY [Lachnospiraceae bacterium]|nr:biotin transporter BioY [Lachnospiraceae bacterium]